VALSATEVWEGYRRGSPAGLLTAVVASSFATPTDRGRELLATLADRHARHAIDLRGLELLD
jgi:hypothetical protein